MSFKPDYGLRMLRESTSKDIIHTFYDFRLYSLSIIGREQYSTMVEIPYDGEMHALSLDFNQSQLYQILSKASTVLKEYIIKELERDADSPRNITFEGQISFGVRARLGELQKVEKESFVPLVAEDIL